MKNKKLAFAVFLGTAFANFSYAVCPVCVVAVGAGLGLSRWLGVDDSISSMWIGGLLASISAWTIFWLEKKNWAFKFYKPIVWLSYYILVFASLFFTDIIGHPLNTILGIDKILFGGIIGTAIFLASVWVHEYLKKKNNGKSYFPYQKIAVPVFALLLASLIFNFVV